jgi:hypothetical protein
MPAHTITTVSPMSGSSSFAIDSRFPRLSAAELRSGMVGKGNVHSVIPKGAKSLPSAPGGRCLNPALWSRPGTAKHNPDARLSTGDLAEDSVGQLVVQLSREALELRGQPQHQRGVDLPVDLFVGQRSTAGGRVPPIPTMGFEQLVQRSERSRYQRSRPDLDGASSKVRPPVCRGLNMRRCPALTAR